MSNEIKEKYKKQMVHDMNKMRANASGTQALFYTNPYKEGEELLKMSQA